MTVRIIEGHKTMHFDIKTAMKCIANNSKYEIKGAEIHHGSYGRVYGVCMVHDKHDTACRKKVVKIIFFPIDDDQEEQKKNLDDLMRELYIFHRLNESGISPKVFEAFGCGNYFNIVLERFGLNLHQVGRKQVNSFDAKFLFDLYRNRLPSDFFSSQREILVFSDYQMRTMFSIAKELGVKYGVIHGDLRPDQYLHELGKENIKARGKIVISDFGFSGTSTVEATKWRALIGWHFKDDCFAIFSGLPPPEDDDNKKRVAYYRDYYNIFQLWFYLSFHAGPVFVIKEGGKLTVFPHHELDSFAKADSAFHIPREAFSLFALRSDCGGLDRTFPYWTNLKRVVPLWS